MLPVITANSIVCSFCQLIAIKHTFNYFNQGLICSAQKKGHCAVPKHTAAWPFSSEIKDGYRWAANPVANTSLLDEHLRLLFSCLLFSAQGAYISLAWEKAAFRGWQFCRCYLNNAAHQAAPSHPPPSLLPPTSHTCKIALILSLGKSLQLCYITTSSDKEPVLTLLLLVLQTSDKRSKCKLNKGGERRQ